MSEETKKELIKLVKRFSFHGIRNSVIYQFPETNLQKIQKKHSAVTKITIITEIAFISESLSEVELNSRLSKLQLLMTYQTNRRWYAWRMQKNASVLDGRDLQSKLLESLEKECVEAEVEIISLPEKYLFRVIKKHIKDGEVRLQPPTVFQYYLDHPYLFSGRKFVQNTIMRALVRSLNYVQFKKASYSGPDVYFLLNLMKSKDAAAQAPQPLGEPGGSRAFSPVEWEDITVPSPDQLRKNARKPLAVLQLPASSTQEQEDAYQPMDEDDDESCPLHLQSFEWLDVNNIR